VSTAEQLQPGDRVTLTLAHGAASSRIEQVTLPDGLAG
jgi:hypothetical protein